MTRQAERREKGEKKDRNKESSRSGGALGKNKESYEKGAMSELDEVKAKLQMAKFALSIINNLLV